MEPQRLSQIPKHIFRRRLATAIISELVTEETINISRGELTKAEDLLKDLEPIPPRLESMVILEFHIDMASTLTWPHTLFT